MGYGLADRILAPYAAPCYYTHVRAHPLPKCLFLQGGDPPLSSPSWLWQAGEGCVLAYIPCAPHGHRQTSLFPDGNVWKFLQALANSTIEYENLEGEVSALHDDLWEQLNLDIQVREWDHALSGQC